MSDSTLDRRLAVAGREPGSSPAPGAGSGPSVMRQVAQFVPDVFIGGGEAAWGMAKGIGTLVLHPIRTARGIWTLATKLVTDPGPTLKAVGAALLDPYVTAVKAGHPGRAVGRGIVEIGSLFVTPADVVNVVRGGRAFAGTTYAGLTAGQGVGRTLSTAGKSARYAMSATGAARDAQILAQMGRANEAIVMAEYASDALLMSQLARKGQFAAAHAALKSLDLARPVAIAGKSMALGSFLSESVKILGLKRFGLVSGHLARDVYTIASEARKAQNAVHLAERILASGATNPGWLVRSGRLALRNPQVFAPMVPTMGKIPDVLGKIEALPAGLPPREGLTPAAAKEIAFRYNLEPSVENVRNFVAEVSGYAGNTIGPDTGTPDQVRQLQVLLRNAKYDVVVTGVWDRTTANAVIDFKRTRDIRQSYRLANGERAVNEYADQNVLNLLLAAIDGSQKGN